MSRFPSALSFLESVAGYAQFVGKAESPSANMPIQLAVIDPAYVAYTYPGTLPKVTFEGEDTLSEKRYVVIGDYRPQPSHRVVMLPVGHTYVILGSLNTRPPVEAEMDDVTATETRAVTTYGNLTTVGPAIGLDMAVGQKALIEVSCVAWGATDGFAHMSFEQTGASGTVAAIDANSAKNRTNTNDQSLVSRTTLITASGSGLHSFTAKYRATAGTDSFSDRRILGWVL